MSSVNEQRNIIVQKNIPSLIKALTGFDVRCLSYVVFSSMIIHFFLNSLQTKDENYKSCLQFCHSHIKYHRYLSVNSHDIKRQVDGMCEKLRFSNFHDTEKIFKKLVEESVSHELAVNHYEKDVMYMILKLLIELAYDPIGNLKTCLREKREIIQPTRIVLRKTEKRSSDNFIALLLKDNFVLPNHETDSELSEWTSSDDENDSLLAISASEEPVSGITCRALDPGALRPPQKPTVFCTEIIENPEKWLVENIQNPWWKDERTIFNIPSDHIVANFCKIWQKHLSERSMGFIKPRNFSFVSEYCLLREILWMFINPVGCKFFKIINGDIHMKTDVTLPSLMPDSLQVFLRGILRSMNIMKKLKFACKNSQENPFSSHTFETYHKILGSYLNLISEFVLEQEEIVKEQKAIYTILVFHEKFHSHAKMLEMLWIIHSSSILDEEKHQSYICAAYLLASLNNHISSSSEKNMKNLAIVFFVKCLQSYFSIFDTWWNEARFVDHRKEFLVEMIEDYETEVEVTRPRLFAKCRDRTLNDDVSKKIVEDRIMILMLHFANKASFTFEIINKMDRGNDVRQLIDKDASMYEEFCESIDEEIQKISQYKIERKKEIKEKEKSTKNQDLIEEIKAEMIKNGDEIMLLALESTFAQLEVSNENVPKPSNDNIEFYDFLNKSTDFLLLPVENVIVKCLKKLLSSKISISEKFLKDIYFNELNVDRLIRDMRKVYFLGSNEVVNLFDTKIFAEVDKGTSNAWANSYTLTISLNDAFNDGINSDSSMNFIVKVNKRSFFPTVIDAIDEIFIRFNVDQNLGLVFTHSVINKYNQGEF